MSKLQRPKFIKLSVTIGVFFWLLSFSYAIYTFAQLPAEDLKKFILWTPTIGTLISLLLNAFLLYKVWGGYSWARTIFLLLLLVSIYPIFVINPLKEIANLSGFIRVAIPVIASLLQLVLLYLPESNSWFKTMKSERNA